MPPTTTVNISDNVAETLFITLYMKSLESKRPDRIINDPDAERMVRALDYDFSKYEKSLKSQVGTCLRVRHFDNLTREFIDTHPDPVVVCIGCGLDSRANRVGSDKGVFYNIDLPEVMELRDRFLPPDERNISLGQSMFDTSWMHSIRDAHPDASFLVISEGVLMYFSEEEVRPLLENVARFLAPGELLFDACTSFGCKLSSKHETVKHTNARFRWGLDDDTVLERWSPNLSLQQVEYYMDKEKHRWDLMSKVFSLIPPLAKGFRMLHYRMDPVPA